jgi:hypothetical protein
MEVPPIERRLAAILSADVEGYGSSRLALPFCGLLLLENSAVKSVLPPVMEPRYSDGACLILLGLLSGPAAVAAH